MAHEIPAVVVGGGINGLGVARSLARAKVPVWLLDADVGRAEMATRAARPLALSAMHGQGLVDDLVRLAQSRFAGQRPVLMLTQEDGVKTVSAARAHLQEAYRFTLPATDVVECLQHKHGFQHMAESMAAPIPSLRRVRVETDLAALAQLTYPAVLKPGAHSAAYGRQFKKAYRVESADQAATLARRILPVMDDLVVQEWIEGDDADIYFCLQYHDRQGRLRASFTGRKLRSWPPQVGGTASCVGAPEAHVELSGMTDAFFQAAGVVGMASMEYKRDRRSRAFRMVEPTIGRTDYQQEVATFNGVNLPYVAWCAELDQPSPDSTPPQRPLAWRVRSEDLRSAAAQNQVPAQAFAGTQAVVDALFRWNDPKPWLMTVRNRMYKAIHSRWVRWTPGSHAARSKP